MSRKKPGQYSSQALASRDWFPSPSMRSLVFYLLSPAKWCYHIENPNKEFTKSRPHNLKASGDSLEDTFSGVFQLISQLVFSIQSNWQSRLIQKQTHIFNLLLTQAIISNHTNLFYYLQRDSGATTHWRLNNFLNI